MKNKPKYKVQRIPLDKDREEYVKKIIEILDKSKPNSYIKNLLQSFVYLILNDDFNNEILKIREVLEKDSLDEQAKKFVTGNNLSYERYEPFIVELIKNYIILKDIPMETLNDKSLIYNRFVGGFDFPEPKIGKENSKDFDRIQWEVYFQPTDNLTQFKRSLERYFVWMMDFHFKEYYKSELFKISNRKNSRKYNSYDKKSAEIKLIPKKDKLIIRFVSYLNTKTKEIERLFDMRKAKIMEFCKKKTELQEDNRAYLFSKNIKIYLLHRNGYTVSEIISVFYPKKEQNNSYSKECEYIGTKIKEVKKSISTIFGEKLTL